MDIGGSFNAALDTIKKLVGAETGATPASADGPGTVGPTTDTKQGGAELVAIPISPEQIEEWWKRIERARQRRKAREDKWELLIKEYLPIVTASGEAETVKVQAHFRNVHSKIGQLFFRSPELVLTRNEPGPADNQMPNPANAQIQPGQAQLPPLSMSDVIAIKKQVLNKILGRDGIKVNRLFDELLFDVLAWSGIGCLKVGYRAFFKQVAPAAPQPGSVLGLTPMPAQSIPVPVHEELYARRFSPKKALWNDDLRSTRFDEDATWTGMEFYMSPRAAQKTLKLTEEEAAKVAEDDQVMPYAEDKTGADRTQLVHGVELSYKSSVFGDEVHPLALTQLVLIESIKDKAFIHRPDPDQEFDPQTGKLTKDSRIGFPFMFLTIRDLADSPFPPSDSAFTNSEIKQLSTWRRQSVLIRDAAIGKYFYDMGAFDENEIEVLKNGAIGSYVGVAEGKLAQGADKVFTVAAQIHQTQDDYAGARDIKQDINETLGISASQAGTDLPTVRTATEIQTFNNASIGRNDKEAGRVTDFYLDLVRKVDSLIMRYMTAVDYVTITGQAGAQKIQAWNNQLVAGKYLYDVSPDSTLRVDTARDFQLMLQYWNVVARSPLSNQPYLLRKMAELRGFDPDRAVLDPSQLPKPSQDKDVVTYAFKGPDLRDPLVVAILLKRELLTPQDIQNAQASIAMMPPIPPEPVKGPAGPAEKADVISQHLSSNSGGLPNAPGSSDHRAGEVK